jgi:ATP-dependent Clp protease protease subunit
VLGKTVKTTLLAFAVGTAIVGASVILIDSVFSPKEKEPRIVPEAVQSLPNVPQVDGSNPPASIDGREIIPLTLTERNTVDFASDVTYPSALEAIQKIKSLALSENTDRIYLLITSPGGSVFAGQMILETIEGSSVPVDTICVGLCASMGAHMHQAGSKRYMTNKSTLMFHPASGGVQGEVETMRSQILYIDRIVTKLDQHVAKRANIPLTEFKRRIRSEYWLDSEDATDMGFNDGIVYLDDERIKKAKDVIYFQGAKDKAPLDKYFKLQ